MARNSARRVQSNISQLLTGFRGMLIFVFSISGVVNILALTGAFYMLQIYDRALTSGSIPTLIALSVLAIVLYMFQGILDVIRTQILVRLGAKLDHKLSPAAYKITIDMPRYGFSSAESIERSRDVDTLRSFMGGQGPLALFDLPWMPLYITFIYFLHPLLGALTLLGAMVMAVLTLLTELLTKKKGNSTQQASIERAALVDSHTRNADVLKAMGFAGRAVKSFEAVNAKHLELHTSTTDIGGTLSGIAKVLRMILQSSILGLGAYLTIKGQLSPGAIIAASIIAARALAPIDMAIAQWKNIASARRSYSRLKETLSARPEEEIQIKLPKPEQVIKLENVAVAAPSTGTVILSDISFELKAGQALGLIGPSGGGKSTLAKAITNVWPLVRGCVRLDGAEINQWTDEDRGQYVGYLPQDVGLLDGTVAQNICRFDPEPEGAEIIEAAKAAGVHELIVRLSEGYQTVMGPDGTSLSAGQRQRVALARALYRNPFLVVLDEPNSNLDSEGELALTTAIEGIRQRGGIAVIIAHRPSALKAVDMIGIIQNGHLVQFGPKSEIIEPKPKQAMNANTPIAAGKSR
ncbi:MAG: type I secretion system permease/ATPase [Hyphomicrobiaceae bacterium]|nr:type I secretion system permease/ATPase [Hyphomicrobiaceae bacterium]